MMSVTILTKNSSKYLKEVLEALKKFPEVVVYDTGSTDSTLKIAESFKNVSIHSGPFIGFGPTHNQASSVAKYDWILSVDSDEIVTDHLSQEITGLTLDPECVYSFPRDNYYRGKWIKGCGWYPDYQVRIYHRKKTKFSDDQVHERILSDHLKKVSLKSALKHYPYGSTEDFLQKMQSYSNLFALQNKHKKSSSFWKALSHGSFAFFKSYVLKRGFLLGKEGFIISVYNANTAFYKYLKLWEYNSTNHR